MKPTLRYSIIYLLLSVVVVLFARYLHTLVIYIDLFYTLLNIKLGSIFSPSAIGVLMRKVVALSLLPVVIAAVPTLIYRAIRGRHTPYFMEIVWLLWLIIVLSKILIY